MNKLRVQLVRNGLFVTKAVDAGLLNKPKPLMNVKILDAGCGGGILSEPLARIGAKVTGIDPGTRMIDVARTHDSLDPSFAGKLRYLCESVENHAAENEEKYDAVVASGVVEHLTQKEQFIESCSKVLKPGGSLFITTINRTTPAWIAAVVAAEQLLHLIPKETHDWEKFITPQELQYTREKCGATNLRIASTNVFSRTKILPKILGCSQNNFSTQSNNNSDYFSTNSSSIGENDPVALEKSAIPSTVKNAGPNIENKEFSFLGTNDFPTLIEEGTFVDKSDFLKDFMKLPSPLMMAVPPRFGKSTMLSMCVNFFGIQYDVNGKELEMENSPHLKLFENLKIYSDVEFFKSHFGKYPVIFLNLSTVDIADKKRFLSSLHEIVNSAMESYSHLIRGLQHSRENQDKVNRIISQDNEPALRLKLLSEFLESHFKQKCIVFVDEYDSIVDLLIFGKAAGDGQYYLDEIGRIIGILLKHSSKSVGRGLMLVRTILTGVLSPFANNFSYYYLLEHERMMPHFGLTEKEVEDLLKKYHLSHLLPHVREWYNGYGNESNLKIYNYFSILSFLSTRKIQSYWTSSLGIKRLDKMFSFKEVLHSFYMILNNNTFKIRYQSKFGEEHIDLLQKMLYNSYDSIPDFTIDLFLQYMYCQGYFNFVKRDDFSQHLELKVSNREIRFHLEHLMELAIWNLVKQTSENTLLNYHKAVLNLPKGTKKCVLEYKNAVEKLFGDRQFPHETIYSAFLAIAGSQNVSKKGDVISDGEVFLNQKRIDTVHVLNRESFLAIIEVKREKSVDIAFDNIFTRRYPNINQIKCKKKQVLLMGLNLKMNEDETFYDISCKCAWLDGSCIPFLKNEKEAVKYQKTLEKLIITV